MSDPLAEPDRANDPYSILDRAAALVLERTRQAIDNDEAGRVSDNAVVDLLTAAIKLYAAKAAPARQPFRPLRGEYDEEVTATEVLTAVIELLRALGLGPMELALWSQRKPRDYAYTARAAAVTATNGEIAGDKSHG